MQRKGISRPSGVSADGGRVIPAPHLCLIKWWLYTKSVRIVEAENDQLMRFNGRSEADQLVVARGGEEEATDKIFLAGVGHTEPISYRKLAALLDNWSTDPSSPVWNMHLT